MNIILLCFYIDNPLNRLTYKVFIVYDIIKKNNAFYLLSFLIDALIVCSIIN